MQPDGAQQAAFEQFRRLCADRGLAVTHQRQVIYEALLHMQNHPSPEAVYERVRTAIPSLSLGTVYKTIHTFLETGLLREVSLHHGSLRIEANMEPHHHLVCTKCRTIVDLPAADARVDVRTPLPAGFSAQRYSIEVLGLCAGCSSEQQ